MEDRRKDNFNKLFHPSSIAVVGASADTQKLGGGRCFVYLKKSYGGNLYPINPKYTDMLGIPCYPSLKDVPGQVDLAVLSLPARQIGGALRECVAQGIKAVCIFSSGFAEVGGSGMEMQREIEALAKKNKLCVLGPNCEGYYNIQESIPVTFSTSAEKEIPRGKIGLISQSGAMGSYLMAEGRQKGIGFSMWISTGNEMNISAIECIDYLLEDPATDIIICYSEGITRGEDLKRIGRKSLERNKPIIFFKAGRTAHGQEAAIFHTGALAANYRIFRSFLNAYGIAEARNYSEIIDLAVFFSAGRFPEARGVGIYTTSGAMGVIATDFCEDLHLQVPAMSEEGSAALLKITPFGAHSNPVDGAGTMNNPDQLKNCLGILSREESISSMLVLTGSAEPFAEKLCASIIGAHRATAKPIAVSWVAAPPGVHEKLIHEGIPAYNDPSKALISLSKAADYARQRNDFLKGKEEPSVVSNEKIKHWASLGSEEARKDHSVLMPLKICASLLTEAGIPVARYRHAENDQEIGKGAEEIGYPVVLKLDCSQLPHKTDLGAVILNIRDEQELRRAVEKFEQILKTRDVGRKRGIFIEEMVPYRGVEVVLGGGVDPNLGPYIKAGGGGPLAEFMDAPSIRPAPITEEGARQMLEENGLLKLIQRYRGLNGDVEALCATMAKLSQLLLSLGSTEIREMDLNPVFVLPEGQGIKVIDFRITLTPEEKEEARA